MEQTLVVDIGSSSTKAGWSGEDSPSYVFPSVLDRAKYKSSESVENLEGSVDPNVAAEFSASPSFVSNHPISRGAVSNWDQLEKYWKVVLDEVGVPITSEGVGASILLVESPRSSPADRLKWAEIMFESYKVPAMSIGNSSSLAMFASGRTTGCVVECGAGLTTCVPVFEGLALAHACVTMDFGGQDITMNLKRALAEKAGANLELADVKIVKERFACVRPVGLPKGRVVEPDMRTVNLPDGTEVTLDSNIFADCTEQLLVNPKMLNGGLISQVHEALFLCDESLRRDLISNITIAGGTSLLPGLGDRLKVELEAKSDAATPVRVFPSSTCREAGYTSQRKHAAWIGGSIMASLDTFRELKISRQDWEDGGDSALITKCF